jgi:hypothetical protein
MLPPWFSAPKTGQAKDLRPIKPIDHEKPMTKLLSLLVVGAAATLGFSTAFAAPIPIANSGFEVDEVADNSTSAVTPASWSWSPLLGSGGSASTSVHDKAHLGGNPVNAGIAGAHSGDQYWMGSASTPGFADTFAILNQDTPLLWASLAAGDQLRLKVWATYRSDIAGSPYVAMWLNYPDGSPINSVSRGPDQVNITNNWFNVSSTGGTGAGVWKELVWTYTVTQEDLDAAVAGSWGAVNVAIGHASPGGDSQVAYDDVSMEYISNVQKNYSWLGIGSSSDWADAGNWWNLTSGLTLYPPQPGDTAIVGFVNGAFNSTPRPVVNSVMYAPEAPLGVLGMDWWNEVEAAAENAELTIAAGGGLEVNYTWMNHGGQETATIHITGGGYLRSWQHLHMGKTAGGTSRINIDDGFVYTPSLLFGPGNSNIDLEPEGYLYLAGDVTGQVATWISEGRITGGGGALELQTTYNTPIAGLTAVTAAAPVLEPPAIVTVTPTDNATGVPVASNLVATFNKPIALTGSGSINLKNLSGGADIPITLPGDVSISGRILTINLSTMLVAGEEYAVEISGNAITDFNDPPQAFVGLVSPDWSFTASPSGAHVKVFLLGGHSNAVGLGSTSGLPTSPVNLQAPQHDVLFYYLGGPGLTTLRPGSGVEFGPEVTFGRAVADASPNVTCAIIKHAVGATNLHTQWAPGTGPIYADFRNTVAAGLAALQTAGYTYEIVGMVWHQGESDALDGQQATYQTNLTNFIADIRSRYGANLRFLIGEIGDKYTPALAALQTVIAAQQAVATADPLSVFVPAKDLPFQDVLHFDTAGMITLGERFAAGYASLLPPADDFGAWIDDPSFGIAPADRGFNDDPDGDGLDNGLEAWFGTHPGQFNPGLAQIATDDTTTTFTHPQNEDPPADVAGFYQWSPDLIGWYAGDGVDGPPGGPTVTITSETIVGTTTVTAVASEAAAMMFMRAGVTLN